MGAPKGSKNALGNNPNTPTVCNDETVALAFEYLEKWEESGDTVPSKEGLYVYAGVIKATAIDWQNGDHEKWPCWGEFTRAVKGIEAIQARQLINKGLTGEFNAPIAKMLLSRQGYAERSEQDIKQTIQGIDIAFVKPDAK